MRDTETEQGEGRTILDRLFAGGSLAVFAVLMSSVGEAVYLYLR